MNKIKYKEKKRKSIVFKISIIGIILWTFWQHCRGEICSKKYCINVGPPAENYTFKVCVPATHINAWNHILCMHTFNMIWSTSQEYKKNVNTNRSKTAAIHISGFALIAMLLKSLDIACSDNLMIIKCSIA